MVVIGGVGADVNRDVCEPGSRLQQPMLCLVGDGVAATIPRVESTVMLASAIIRWPVRVCTTPVIPGVADNVRSAATVSSGVGVVDPAMCSGTDPGPGRRLPCTR